jgi:hypothetical protein
MIPSTGVRNAVCSTDQSRLLHRTAASFWGDGSSETRASEAAFSGDAVKCSLQALRTSLQGC